MATSSARSPRPWPLARDIDPAHDGLRDDEAFPAYGEDAVRQQPAWLVDLTEQVTRSVFAIERMVQRVTTMREDNSYFRAMATDLREALDSERSESGRRLVEQGRTMTQHQRRAVEAERSADALAGMLCDLERQLTGRRTQGGRLAAGSDRVVHLDAGRGERQRRDG